MLRWFTRFSLKNAAVLVICMIMIILGGLWSYFTIPTADYPNVDIPFINLSISYPGATPNQVFNDIGKLLEPKLSTIDGLKNLYSYSGPGFQEFDLEVNMNRKDADVDKDIQDVLNQVALPSTAQKPVITNQSISSPSVYTFAVSADHDSLTNVENYVQNTVQPALTKVNGVASVTINGVSHQTVYVQVNPTKLAAKGVSWQQVSQALADNQFSAPIGTLQAKGQSLPVLVSGNVTSIEQIRNIAIPAMGQPTGSIVHVGDIANVVAKVDPTSAMFTRTNGKPGVVVKVIPGQNANTIQVVQDVKNSLNTLSVPAGYHVQELDNQATQVKQSVNGMIREAALGALFAVIVTLIFLRDLRATIVALISIPLSIFAALIVINAYGYSLNIMTLSGMAVAVGRVVDDSIVVIENIYRRLRLKGGKQTTEGLEGATLEVGSAITSSTITTVAVFVPMTMVPGIVGHVFAPFAWTVIIALAFSLLVALMVVPIVSRTFLRRAKPVKKQETTVQRTYRSMLKWALSHKLTVILISVLLIGESLYSGTKIGFNFLPSSRQTQFMIQATMPVASSIDATNNVAKQIESQLQNTSGIDSYQTFVKSSGAEVDLNINNSVKDTDAFATELRNKMKHVTGAHLITVTGAGGISDNKLQLFIEGDNYSHLVRAANQAQVALQKIPGLVDVTTSVQSALPQVQVTVRPNDAAHYGLDPTLIAGAIHNMLLGNTIMTINLQGQSTDVHLMSGSGNINSVNALKQEVLTRIGTHEVTVGDVADVSTANGPTAIARLNQQQYIQVSGTIISNNQSAVTSKVNQTMAGLHLPQGVSYNQEGASQEMNQGFQNIALAMLVSFVLVLMVMLVTFGGWVVPLSIAFALPFALVGGLNSLWITHQPLGMPGMIGFMMLIGIIVTNAIVLMDRVQQQRKLGLSVRDALLEAGGVRLRPILMTATATVGALIPLAVTTDAGLISKTLAIVVIGGLISSTILTLFIVPIVFELFTRRSERKRIRRGDVEKTQLDEEIAATLED